eukprot:1139791-Pelagomonas_calceolata.AAC.1
MERKPCSMVLMKAVNHFDWRLCFCNLRDMLVLMLIPHTHQALRKDDIKEQEFTSQLASNTPDLEMHPYMKAILHRSALLPGGYRGFPRAGSLDWLVCPHFKGQFNHYTGAQLTDFPALLCQPDACGVPLASAVL